MAAPERNTTADRVPPHDTEAEQCVLGCCLLDDEAALRALEIVTPFDFYRDAHRTVMAAVQVVNSRREPVDLATVAAELRRTGQLENVGGAEYLTAVVNKVPTAAHVIRYATIVAEKSLLRRMITEAAAIQDAAYSNPANVGNALNDAASRITRIMDERLSERVGIQPMAARASGLVALAEEAGRGAQATERGTPGHQRGGRGPRSDWQSRPDCAQSGQRRGEDAVGGERGLQHRRRVASCQRPQAGDSLLVRSSGHLRSSRPVLGDDGGQRSDRPGL